MAKLPVEQLAALVSLASRFTTSARSHAALGLANAALCAEQVRSAACLRSLPPSPPRPPRAAASATTTWPLHRLPLLHPPLLLPPPRPQREVLRTSGLLEPALKQLLELAAAEGQPEVQGAAALALALLALDAEACELMLKGGAIGSLAELLRSADHDAVRCAAFTLAALAAQPKAPPRIARAFSPRVLVMICSSKDFFLQARPRTLSTHISLALALSASPNARPSSVPFFMPSFPPPQSAGARLLGLLAAEPHQQLRLLRAHALQPLVATAQASRSSTARFEATRALHLLTLRPDVAIAAG